MRLRVEVPALSFELTLAGWVPAVRSTPLKSKKHTHNETAPFPFRIRYRVEKYTMHDSGTRTYIIHIARRCGCAPLGDLLRPHFR